LTYFHARSESKEIEPNKAVQPTAEEVEDDDQASGPEDETGAAEASEKR